MVPGLCSEALLEEVPCEKSELCTAGDGYGQRYPLAMLQKCHGRTGIMSLSLGLGIRLMLAFIKSPYVGLGGRIPPVTLKTTHEGKRHPRQVEGKF